MAWGFPDKPVLPMKIIDSHQHFWNYDPVTFDWINDSMKVLRKDFLPEDLQPVLEANGVAGCVAVQAGQSEEETRFLLELSRQNDFIKGVVGWVDLLSDTVEDRLAYFASNPDFKGVRHIVQSEAADFLLRDDFQRGISKLNDHNLTYDILIFPEQLRAAITMVAKFPGQTFILDHLGKPFIKDGRISSWKADLTELASHENVYCKVSGMVTEADWDQWEYNDFVPYLDTVFEAFGTQRIMFGSDWPVCKVAGSYTQVLEILKTYTAALPREDQRKIFGENAARAYNL